MTRNLVIIGAGRFGREVHTWARQAIAHGASWRFKGFLDDRAGVLDSPHYAPGVIATVESYAPCADDVFLCAVGDPVAKRRYSEPILARGGEFATLVHPSALVGDNVRIGAGAIIAPFSLISCDVEFGRFASLGAFSGAAHDTAIGDWCQISGHCGINGGAILEEGVFLGSHAVILPDVRIGAFAFVGAGSVVLRPVKPRTKVFGNPAVPIGLVEGS